MIHSFFATSVRRFIAPFAFLLASLAGTDALAASGSLCPTDTKDSAPRSIREEKFVRIGGIEQWVTISGTNCANPIVLIVHGGPGNPMTPYSDAIYGSWTKQFTIVQWDQRGAGRTYGRNRLLPEPDSRKWTPEQLEALPPLTIAQLTQDGVEVASYSAARLGQRKVILVGGSWGSALGVHMVKVRPELFHAYMGTGQIVHYTENERSTYETLLVMARAATDTKTVAMLESLGAPPWKNPRAFGMVRKATRVYEAKTSTPPPKSWWTPADLYSTREAELDYEAGEEYSFLQFVGFKGDGMLSTIDLHKLGANFDVPVFLLQGTEDLVTTPAVAKRYFDSIVGPVKEFIWLPHTGHDPNATMLDTQLRTLATRVVPITKQTE
ncbi:alpha/beta fold hydrolase [Massilia sp. CF038]|uniref:alpha/beta fold hydrolase n=1 Tax=Massilia sp. CF038 TaxID=1881045 RepID=UPI00091F639B|nr:alpha/beta hydrolase [Massilia sp. CF038]SHH67852.1 Pimeloyl-ACP methyl ester carboxylesterase [Massilia sp. CF038]